MRVLGIETSCDETGVAIYDSTHGLLAECLYSQVALHAKFGGVVPELASRDHVQKLLPLINEVMGAAASSPGQLDGIAYTSGPGLIGALMVGACTAKSLALAWSLPVIGIHHMEGHLLAPMLEKPAPEFPLVALLVSGGHTQLVLVKRPGEYCILGESLDDAAGEAFDKTAKLLGLPYPGGPALARLAEMGQPERFMFPRPLLNRPGLDFSFSGLKTAVLNAIHQQGTALDEQCRADIAASFQQAMVETLVKKCERALEQSHCDNLLIAGGVSANHALRSALEAMVARRNARLFLARPSLCTDNGAMIAHAGCLRLLAGQRDGPGMLLQPRWPLSELAGIAGEHHG